MVEHCRAKGIEALALRLRAPISIDTYKAEVATRALAAGGSALIMDPNTNTPIVVLKSIEGETVLPIWVGAFEANAIALEIEKVVDRRGRVGVGI